MRNIGQIVLFQMLLLVAPVELKAQFIYTNINGAITITGYSGSGGTVIIPDRINGLLVNTLGSRAFYENMSVTNVVVPNSVSTIDTTAFFDCQNLISVTIGSSVGNIGQSAFEFCSQLASVYFEGNAPGLPDDNVFNGNNNAVAYYLAGTMGWSSKYGNELPTVSWNPFNYLTNNGAITITGLTNSIAVVSIPGAINGLPVTQINTNAFTASGLTSVLIPGAVTNIGDYAFNNCTNLMAVYFQGGAPSLMGPHTFANDTNATVYYLPDTSSWGSSFGGLATAPWIQFGYTTNAGTITITGYPGSGGPAPIPGTINGVPVTGIGGLVCYDNHYVTSTVIPNSVTNIGMEAFSGCTGMTNLTLGTGVITIGNSAFLSCIGLSSLTIPGSVTTIGTEAFVDCTGLTNLIIPGNVTSIGDQAFSACSGLTGVTISNGVTTIGRNTFNDCTGLGNLAFPDSVTNIGDEALGQCSSLTNVEIGDGVAAIGTNVFTRCFRLTVITVDPLNPSFSSAGGVLFGQNQTMLIAYPPGLAGSYIVPGSVTAIANTAFSTCPNLTGVTMDNSVTNIGLEAFYNCPAITNVNFPYGLSSIGDEAFLGCVGLTSVAIPGTVNYIGSAAFYECYGITNLTLGNGVPGIGNGSFEGCTHITSITIPASVSSIGAYAFGGCSTLTSVFFLGNAPTSIGTTVFYGDNVTAYYLPGTSGWSPAPFGDNLPRVSVVPWYPHIQTAAAQSNGFGFNISWASGQTVVVQACTNLANPVWVPLVTNTLATNIVNFSDPQWTNFSGRFYRISSQ